jgi:hypothetical protein
VTSSQTSTVGQTASRVTCASAQSQGARGAPLPENLATSSQHNITDPAGEPTASSSNGYRFQDFCQRSSIISCKCRRCTNECHDSFGGRY